MDNNELYNFLCNNGCCKTCCLRFLKARGDEYDYIEQTLSKLGIESQETIENQNSDEVNVKKQRKNPCVGCLDLFSNELLNEITNKIINDEKLREYDCKEFVLAFSFPILLNIRQLSLWISLIKKFNEKYEYRDKVPDVPIKEAIKLILGPKLCGKLNKEYNPNGIMINITMDHKDEENDLNKLMNIENKIFKENIIKNNKKQQKRDIKEISRGYFERNYLPNNIKLDEYEKHMSVPPDFTTTSIYLEKITFTGPTVFLAGRYRKFSRHLSHSPWVLQGRRIMEDSIQEIIIRIVAPHFRVPIENIIFSSSGREDVDVRCLGDGRPFVLEILDSKLTTLPINIAKEIELSIAKSKLVSIQHLQMVKRDELSYLKSGEENKRKIYRALCTLNEPVTLETLKKLDMPNGFVTYQITPIRVLHRRPLHTRPRTIYSVKGYVDRKNPKIVILDIITQAGTYVKELVHGEFGRTHPSISSIVGIWIDIIALDVTAVELEWPTKINNRNEN